MNARTRMNAMHGVEERKLLCALVLGVMMAAGGAQAKSSDRDGPKVVEAVCGECHVSGKDGAPKIGDPAAWIGRASQGLTALTAHAISGIRKMPAHGGNPGVTDVEIERAITYMVNQSGGKWTVPTDKTVATKDRSGEQVVRIQCTKCHQTGEGGAPKIGDREAWAPRARYGFDKLVRSAINGHGGMPARGGMADLTDSELRSAITYMINSGNVVTR